jgi:L-lactate dehydrogenase (cytochrome)
MKAASVQDYREKARRRLPHFLFEYIDGGSFFEVTLRRNVADLANISLRQRILRDVSRIDLSTEIFGEQMAMPVLLGPVGLAGLNARRGETQAVRAAHDAEIQFCLPTLSACSMDEVALADARPFWFQLNVTKDRGFVRDLLAKARDTNVSALLVTVDVPVSGSRYREHRSGMANAAGLLGTARRVWQIARRPGWAWDVGIHGRPHNLGNVAPLFEPGAPLGRYIAWLGANFDASVVWKDLDFIRDEWQGPLIIKGILDVEDAREAVKFGADGIVVSNHGGRQLDGATSTAHALPSIVDAVGDDLTVLVDGGVRSGLDVVRMLALGAKGVLLGRAWAYALAGGGGAGVTHILKLIQAEMLTAMALAGVTEIRDIDRNILARKF